MRKRFPLRAIQGTVVSLHQVLVLRTQETQEIQETYSKDGPGNRPYLSNA